MPKSVLVSYLEKWVGCLASALNDLHAKNVLHGDIKPSGIQVEGGKVFFAEFAISNHHRDSHMLASSGTSSSESGPGATAVVTNIYAASEVYMQQ